MDTHAHKLCPSEFTSTSDPPPVITTRECQPLAPLYFALLHPHHVVLGRAAKQSQAETRSCEKRVRNFPRSIQRFALYSPSSGFNRHVSEDPAIRKTGADHNLSRGPTHPSRIIAICCKDLKGAATKKVRGYAQIDPSCQPHCPPSCRWRARPPTAVYTMFCMWGHQFSVSGCTW